MELYKFEKQKEYNDVDTGNEDKEKKRKNSEYYDLGKEVSEEKETELILFEKFPVADIISLRSDSKSKNIVNISVRKQKEKEIEIEIEKKKGKRPSIHTDQINIVLDFSSVNDSKYIYI